jgi:hypothetical protein
MTTKYDNLITPTDMEISYFAGIFDGEGNVYITKPSSGGMSKIIISVWQNDGRLIDWIWDRFGGYKGENMKGKRWQQSNQKAAEILKIIYPYSIIKKEAIEIALSFQELKTINNGRRKLSIQEIENRELLRMNLSAVNRTH